MPALGDREGDAGGAQKPPQNADTLYANLTALGADDTPYAETIIGPADDVVPRLLG